MSENSAVNKIINMRSAGIRFGTERTRALLNALGSPDDKLKIIHVAGTNGKGSVCEYLTRILVSAGKRTGTYTTPEIYSFYDQFRINCSTDEKLADECMALADRAAEELEDKPTAYERQTAAAFLMFAKAGCEYAVIECCMGGLYDTTNAANKKVMAVITSISLEHTKFLGNTLSEIAAHKAGIIKSCPAVISRCVPQSVRNIFYSLGAQLALSVDWVTECAEGTYFNCGEVRYFTHMQGCMQPYNAAAAITAARILGISEDAVAEGIKLAYAPGRLQQFDLGGAQYILDGAHNPESFIPLATLLKTRFKNNRRAIIYGCLGDKDVTAAMAALKGCAESITCVPAPSYRAMDYDKMTEACRAAFSDVVQANRVSDALDRTRAEVVAVCGSFTLLKEAEKWIEKRQ